MFVIKQFIDYLDFSRILIMNKMDLASVHIGSIAIESK